MARKQKTMGVIIALVGLAALIPLVAALFLNSGQARSVITAWVESRTGREFSIDGRLGVAMGLSATIVAHDVRLSNSGWALVPDMLSIDKLSITLSVPGLLKGEGLIREIHVLNPVLRVERHPETGKFNTVLGKNTRSGPGFLASQLSGIRQLSVRGGRIVYYHPRRRWEFDVTDAVARSPAIDQPVELDISGAIGKTAIALGGQTGSFRSLIGNTETRVSLQGHIAKPENTLLVSGAIDQFRRWRGLNLSFEAFITDLSDLSGLIGIPLHPWRSISASWKLVQPDSPRTLRMDSIEIFSPDYGLESVIRGRIGYLPRFRQLALTFSAKGNLDHGALSDKWNRDIVLAAAMEGTLARDQGDLRLTLNHGSIRSTGMTLDLSGTIEKVTGDWSNPLQVSLKLDDLTRLGDLTNRQLPSVPNISASGNLFRLGDGFRLLDILLENDSPGVKALAVGSLENPGAQQRGVIDFSVRAESDIIKQWSGSDLSGFLQYLTVAGTAYVDANNVSVPQVSIDAQGPGVHIEGNGELGSVGNTATLRVELKGSVQGLDKLRDWAGQPLPPTEAITFSAELRGDERRKLNLGNIQVNMVDPAISAELSGEIRNLGKSPKLILNFSAEIREAQPFLKRYPGLSTERFGALAAELLPARVLGKLRSTEIQDGGVVHRIEKLEILSDSGLKGRATGRIDHLFTGQWGGPVSFRVYGELDEGVLPPIDADLVDLRGYLDSVAEISVSGQGIAVERVQARLISGYSETRLAGKIESLSPFATSGLELTAYRPSLDDLFVEGAWSALARDIPVHGKLVFSNVERSPRVSLDLKMADSDLSGDIYWSVPSDAKSGSGNGEPLISGDFVSQNMDLVQLLPARQDSPGFFSRNHIRMPWLDHANASIKADFRRLESRVLRLDDVVLDTQIRGGRMFSRVTGESGSSGSMDIILSLSNRAQGGLQSRVRIKGSDVALAALAATEELDYEQEGVFSVQAEIDGHGRSVAEIMGSANGLIRVRLNRAILKNRNLGLFGGDLFLGLLTALNPFTTRDEVVRMDCGVLNFDLQNGVASNSRGIALKTADFALLGGGEVDFSRENLDLKVSTRARKGLGISAGSFFRLLLVKGKISDPEFQVGGPLEIGASLGVGYLTGGLSLFVRGLFDRTEVNSDVCAMAMEG